MISLFIPIPMKKACSLFLLIFVQLNCSLFKPKVSSCPSEIQFPLEKETEVLYEGKIIDLLQRSQNKFFFSTNKGNVYCINGAQQDILWKYTSPEPLVSFPFLGANQVFVFDEKNTLYCLDHKGRLQWKKHIPGKLTSQIGGESGQIFVGAEKGILFCLSAENGDINWSFNAEGAIRSNPVVWNDRVIFGCDDHHVYFLNLNGNLIWKHQTESRVGKTLYVDENFLFFGTSDHHVHCLDLRKRKLKWSVNVGGDIYTPPAVKGNKIFFISGNGVLFCLNKRNGTVLWWNQLPSRSYYSLEVTEDKVTASSLSSQLVSFDIKTGKKEGNFYTPREIKSNPLWFSPYLLVNLYDRNQDIGKLVFLKKKVSVALSPSKKSPQTVLTEIIFTAESTGFFEPKYEFYMTRLIMASLYPGTYFLLQDGEKTVVQEESEKRTWRWPPSEPGIYIIEVKALDKKETASDHCFYEVHKEKADTNLLFYILMSSTRRLAARPSSVSLVAAGAKGPTP